MTHDEELRDKLRKVLFDDCDCLTNRVIDSTMVDIMFHVEKHVASMRAELNAAQSQIAALKAVIKAVGWVATYGPTWSVCAWCGKQYPNHAPDCPRQVALGLTKGGE